jgi:amino acid transporter
MPHLHLSNVAFLVVIINGFSGIQVIAFHAQNTHQPEKTYKSAIFNIVIILLMLAILGTLSMAVVLPQQLLNLIGGLVESFDTFLKSFHLQYLTPIIAVMVGIGVLSEINAWIIGPAKGLFAATETGFLPKFLKKTNKKSVPVAVLTLQAVISSFLGMAYLFMSNVNSAYWLLSDLTAQFTLLMWLLVFSSVIVLKFKYKNTQRPFVIPGKNFGGIVIPAIGWFTCLSIFFAGFFPPELIMRHHETALFESALIGGLALFAVIPFLLKARQPS